MKAKRITILVDETVFNAITADGVVQIIVDSGEDFGFKFESEDVEADPNSVVEASDVGYEE